MTITQKVKCDSCEKESSLNGYLDRPPIGWLTVEKSSGSSTLTYSTGGSHLLTDTVATQSKFHLCSWGCLRHFSKERG